MSSPESLANISPDQPLRFQAEPPADQPALRLGGFDLVRILAAFAVVILHASAPYLVQRMPGLTWPVFDTPSQFVNLVGWSIELFIMPLFLLMAGFFTPAIYRKGNGWGFIRHRFKRLIVPLCVAMIIVLPADLYIWLTGWLIEGHITPRKIQSLKFDNGVDEGLWGLSHLWFLQYLFLYAVAWVGVKHISSKYHFAWPFSTKSNILILAVIGWFILFTVPKVVFGFQHDFLPVPSKWFYSGLYFFGGILLSENHKLQLACRKHWPLLLLTGAFATLLGVHFGCQMLDDNSRTILRMLASFLTVVSAWTISLGSVGWASRSRLPTSPAIRYLAAASFWVYLIHHPIVGLCHIQLKVLFPAWPAEAKMVTATATALAFSLLSFEVLIRRWPLAGLLGTPHEFHKSQTPNPEKSGTKIASGSETKESTHSAGGLQTCQGDSSIGLSPRRWRASSSASIQ